MKKRLVLVLASLSIMVSCGGGSSSTGASPTNSVAATANPSGTSAPAALTTAQPAATTAPAPAATTAASGSGSDYASIVCEAIKAVEASVAKSGTALLGEAGTYQAAFTIEMTNRLPAEKLKSAMDDAAVQKACPTEYALILKQMELSTLTSV
jgi:hypothetical protein